MARPKKVSFSDADRAKKDGTLNRDRWWKEPTTKVAATLTAYCSELERNQEFRRFKAYTYSLMATGRAPVSFSMAMSGRVTGARANTEFESPSQNLIAIGLDVFRNKTYCNAAQTFLEYVPLASSETKVRTNCKQGTTYVDQLSGDLGVPAMFEQMEVDAHIWGTGLIRVDESGPGKIGLTRVCDDDVLLDPSAGENPRAFQLRVFEGRDTLIEKYAVGKDADKIRAKLQDAPGVYPAFQTAAIGYQDTLALCHGWYLEGPNGEPGRHVVAIDDVCLLDEPWEGELPLAKFVFEPVGGSYRGIGAVEMQLPLQRTVDEIDQCIRQAEKQFAFPKPQIRRSENIDIDALVADGSVVEYNEQPAIFSPGVAPPKELYQQSQEKARQCLLRIGISNTQAAGQAPEGLTSGIAQLAAMQIDDTRHKAIALRAEASLEQLGRLILAQAARTKPEVYYQGVKVNFPAIQADAKKAKLRAFPMSSMPNSIAGRKQWIADQYADGSIDRVQKARLENVPYTQGRVDEYTASEDLVRDQLDEIVATEKPIAPLPFSDLVRAKSIAIARYQIEAKNKLPQKVLQLLSQYISMVVERLKEQTPEPPALPAPAPIPGPPSAPPALPPSA